MPTNRRAFLRGLLSATGVAAAAPAVAGASASRAERVLGPLSAPAVSGPGRGRGAAPLPPPRVSVPVETPDVPKLPHRVVNGAKEFRLVAEPVRTEFLPASSAGPARVVDAWGFNGSVPGPTIEVYEGDRVRFIVENRLPEVFSMHWHGLEVPIGMDGVPGISQDPIPPGGTFVYEFTLHQHGTFFYHSHMPMQELLGMIGLFVIHPTVPYEPRVHRDFGLIWQGWAILPNNTVPNTLAMEFNWLTINGKAGPATTPLLVRLGERVRIRLVNLSMDHHPIHLHGNTFCTVATEGGRIPRAAWEPGNTVLVGVAQARDIEFDALYPGDWMLHCHLPHHMMNQMASMVGPMTMSHGRGMATGRSMEPGMGIVEQGHALAEGMGPSLGRSIGISADAERAAPNMPSTPAQHAGMQHGAPVAANANEVPGFPQDMWMVMDDAFTGKPETYGLRPTWTAGMMGMMTLVRVLEPELFDRIAQLRVEQQRRKAAE
jgi:FtsP/CotA-like multicopper oxidase with cupredoxin domain